VVVGGHPGSFPFTVPLQAHLHLWFKPVFDLLNFLALLVTQFLKPHVVVRLKLHFFVFDLVVQQVLREKFDLLIDIARFFQKLIV